MNTHKHRSGISKFCGKKKTKEQGGQVGMNVAIGVDRQPGNFYAKALIHAPNLHYIIRVGNDLHKSR